MQTHYGILRTDRDALQVPPTSERAKLDVERLILSCSPDGEFYPCIDTEA